MFTNSHIFCFQWYNKVHLKILCNRISTRMQKAALGVSILCIFLKFCQSQPQYSKCTAYYKYFHPKQSVARLNIG